MTEGTSVSKAPGVTNRPRSSLQRFLSEPFNIVSLSLFFAVVLVCLILPLLGLPDPTTQVNGDELLPPGSGHWFGTDDLGRDMLARTLWGMRLSLGIGISAAVSAGIIGIFLGLIQGYFSGFVDELIGRVNDTLLAFPGLILGLGVAAFVGEGYAVAAIAACLINAPLIARIARAASIVEADKDYVAVVRAMGLPVWRILLFHLLPNILPIAMVQVTLTMAQAMILEAALSFLGLGIQPPSPSLGNLLRDAQSYVDYAIWLPIIPGIVLSLTLILLTHIADAIAEAFDPKRRSR